MVQFVKIGELSGSTSRSDDGGFFRVGLTPGTYIPQVQAGSAEGESVWISSAEFTVAPREEVHIDFFTDSTFLLSGGFYRLDKEGELQDGAMLQVEILLASDTETCIATAWCSTDKWKVDKYLERLGADQSPDDSPFQELRYPPGMGYFEIPNLPPNLYEIRAYWDVGKKYYVRVIADLRTQAVDFGLNGVKTKAFVTHQIIHDSRDGQ